MMKLTATVMAAPLARAAALRGAALLRRAAVICGAAVLAVAPAVGAAADDGWQAGRTIDGVAVDFRPTESGFHVHRAETSICTDLNELATLVGDSSRFTEWVPFTKSAETLDSTPDEKIYYVRSASPWPMKDRDMVYRITREDLDSGTLQLRLTGLPDHRPPVADAERIRRVAGEWRLVPEEDRVTVRYELYVDPGNAPPYFANRRLAAVVGRTLANLVARFPCTPL